MIDPDKPLPVCFQCGEVVELSESMTLGVKRTETDGETAAEDIAVFHTPCWEQFRREHDLP